MLSISIKKIKFKSSNIKSAKLKNQNKIKRGNYCLIKDQKNLFRKYKCLWKCP